MKNSNLKGENLMVWRLTEFLIEGELDNNLSLIDEVIK